MDVKKIFTILITIVACVIIGAFLLNVVLPNATNGVVVSIENMIYKATGLQIGIGGTRKAAEISDDTTAVDASVDATEATISADVAGWSTGASTEASAEAST